MNISELMISDVKTCTLETTLDFVAQMMWENDCGSIPVVDAAGNPVGMVTDRDILMASNFTHKPIWELTTREVIDGKQAFSCHSYDDVKKALEIMKNNRVRRVPVTDGSGHIQGIVTMGDIVANSGKSGLSNEDTLNTLKTVCVHH